ncbi:MAG: MerC domain-containing protein, partial [Nanoarchaeota archaeon]|nr:MerC domain-containing protein [Nanoarchaeota archaeon]
MNKKLIYLALMFSFLLMPAVSALTFDPVVDFLGDLGQFLEGVFNSSDAQVFVFFILLFIVVYAALDVSLSKVKVFEGKDKQRKLFAVGMAFLTDFSLFLTTNPRDFVARMITFAGPFGGILLGIIAFLAIYKALDVQESQKKWPRVLMALGAGCLVSGMLMGPGYESLTTIGVILLIWGVIGMVMDLAGGGNRETGTGGTGTGRGGSDAPEGNEGPGRIRYNNPNVLEGIAAFTEYLRLANGRINRTNARIIIQFRIDAERWTSERIQNLEVEIRHRGRVGRRGRRIGLFPTPNRNAFRINHDFDFSQNIVIRTRAVNNTGRGDWSEYLEFIVGQNPVNPEIEIIVGAESQFPPLPHMRPYANPAERTHTEEHNPAIFRAIDGIT